MRLLEVVINMTAATALLPPAFILIAYLVLRVKYDDVTREFRFGGRSFGRAIAIFLVAIFAVAFVAATFPEGQPLWLTLIYNVGGVVIFLGAALLWYERYIRRLRAESPEAAVAELALRHRSVPPEASLLSPQPRVGDCSRRPTRRSVPAPGRPNGSSALSR